MERTTLNKALQDLEKHYSTEAVADMIAAAYNAIDAYIFPAFHPSESFEEMQKRHKQELKNYKECDKALSETADELDGIVITLSHADDCDELKDVEISEYYHAEEEARTLFDRVTDALEYIADAKQAYDALCDNMRELEWLARE